jgi:hypothetical protein
MKKITYIILGMSLLAISSCYKKDNMAEPDVQIHGTIIDFYTKQPLLSSQADWSIRYWEKSWTESVAQFRELPVKQDGSYNNTKQFAGTYDMLPYGGPFWPIVDTAKNVAFSGSAQQDFTVIPYLQVVDLTTSVSGTNLTITCHLKAPKRVGLPNLVEVKAFLSLTAFVGESNYINIPEFNDKRVVLNKSWIDDNGDVETSRLYTIGPLPVKSGYTYNVRVGANVNDAYRKYNYSAIKQVIVP